MNMFWYFIVMPDNKGQMFFGFIFLSWQC